MLARLRHFAATQPVIVANTLALATSLITWAVSDNGTATAIVALLTSLVATLTARAMVSPTPHVEQAKAAAWVDGAARALYVPAPPHRSQGRARRDTAHHLRRPDPWVEPPPSSGSTRPRRSGPVEFEGGRACCC